MTTAQTCSCEVKEFKLWSSLFHSCTGSWYQSSIVTRLFMQTLQQRVLDASTPSSSCASIRSASALLDGRSLDESGPLFRHWSRWELYTIIQHLWCFPRYIFIALWMKRGLYSLAAASRRAMSCAGTTLHPMQGLLTVYTQYRTGCDLLAVSLTQYYLPNIRDK